MSGKKNKHIKRKNKGRSRQSPSSNLSQNTVCTLFTFGVPIRVTQASSGTGGLTSVENPSSLSNSNTMVLDPFSVGGRTAIMAAQFQKYRVKRGWIKYRPETSLNGLVDQAAGPSTTPMYQNRGFAMGIFKDPALSSITYENIMQTGGFYGSTTKSFTLKIPPSGWLWTSTTASSPTTIDLRTTSFGKLFFAYFIASTTAIASYGQIEIYLDLEFSGSIDNASLLGEVIARQLAHPRSHFGDSSTSSPSTPLIEDEDEKAFTEVKQSTAITENRSPIPLPVVKKEKFSVVAIPQVYHDGVQIKGLVRNF